MVLPGIWRKDHRLQFPFLAGFAVLLSVALPLAELNLHPEVIDSYAVTRFSFMALLCLAATWLGYSTGGHRAGLRDIHFDTRRLTISAILLVTFGFYFGMKYLRTDVTTNEEGAMSGISTIYITLAKVMSYGFVIAAIIYMRTKNWKLIPLLVPQLWAYLSMFLVGRRSPTGELIVIILMLLFFYRKWAPPFWALLVGMVLMTVFSLNIGEMRATNDQPLAERLETLSASDPLQVLRLHGESQEHRYVEIYNGAKYMEGRSIGGHYGLGLHFWNQLVFGFVPGQIVGQNVKQSFMFDLKDDSELAGFLKNTGTCETGFGEAFMAFGYFGCFLFYFLGSFMRWAWEGAVRGSILHQYILLLCTVQGVQCFSIQLWTFVNLVVNIIIFAGPFLWWSKRPGSNAESNVSKQGGPRQSRRKTRFRSDLKSAEATLRRQ